MVNGYVPWANITWRIWKRVKLFLFLSFVHIDSFTRLFFIFTLSKQIALFNKLFLRSSVNMDTNQSGSAPNAAASASIRKAISGKQNKTALKKYVYKKDNCDYLFILVYRLFYFKLDYEVEITSSADRRLNCRADQSWQFVTIATLYVTRSTLHERQRSRISTRYRKHWCLRLMRMRASACQAEARPRSPPSKLSKMRASGWQRSSPSTTHFCKESRRERRRVDTALGRGKQARTRAQRSQDGAQSGHFRQQTRLVHRVSLHGRCVSWRVYYHRKKFHARHLASPTTSLLRSASASIMTSSCHWRPVRHLQPRQAMLPVTRRGPMWSQLVRRVLRL